MAQMISKFKPKGACHRVNLRRPIPRKQKGVKEYCDTLSLYENIPARIGESRRIEENRLDDDEPAPRYGSDRNDERVIMLCPGFPLNNLRAGDFVCIPWGYRPNQLSPVPLLPGLGPQIWIDTPNGPELLTWVCQADGTCAYEGSVQIYLNQDSEWCMEINGQEFCFDNFNFMCSEFPDGYSFIRSTGPEVNYKILKIDAKEDHLCKISHYSVFAEFYDQDCVQIQ